MTYTLVDFENIRNQGFEYTIPKESYELIQKLAKTVGDVGYSPTPVFPKKDKPKPIREPFKATKRIETVGNDKRIQELTSMLNKITHDTVVTMTEQIIEKIEDIEQEGNNDDMSKVYKIIFEMMISNRFYIESYVKMFIMLNAKWDALNDKLMELIQIHRESLSSIEVCDTTDYDKFCRLKLFHDHQRTMTQFMVYLVIHKQMDVSVLKSLYLQIDKDIQEHINVASKKGIVEELCEHVFIILTVGKSVIPISRDSLEKITKLNIKEHPGLSNKIVFRYMDIIESIFV